MLQLRYNPEAYQHFSSKIDPISGFHTVLNLPNRNQALHKCSEIKRYQRFYEDAYSSLIVKSIIIIQKHVRSLLAKAKVRRRIAEIEYETNTRCSLIIQCAYNAWIAAQFVKQVKADNRDRILRLNSAKKIQKLFRLKQLRSKTFFFAIVNKISRIRKIAACKIQKVARGYIVRKDLPFIKNLKLSRLVRWIYDADEVSIVGTFTNPPWKHQIPLVYSVFLKEFFSTYFIDNKLTPGRYYLKFIVAGQWLCDGNMPIAQDIEGNYNNLMVIASERKPLPKASSTQSLIDNPLGISKPVPQSPSKPPQKLLRTLSGGLYDSAASTAFLNQPENTEEVLLKFGYFMVAYPKQRHAPLTSEGTADAIFIDDELQLFGLSDGVGEWETYGLDSSLFSRELMENCKNVFREMNSNFKPENENCEFLIEVLEKAYKRVKNYGSATAFLGMLRGYKLYTLCLGDSGFMVIREREGTEQYATVYRSSEQQHSFNCPYQLAYLPEPGEYPALIEKGLNSLVSLLKKSNRASQDMPSDAYTEIINLAPGDIIVVATDGLFDNLFDQDVIKICENNKTFRSEKFCIETAKELVINALQKGTDSTYRSPFSKNAARYGKRFIGGKLDDTSVIVAIANLKNNI